MIGLNLNYGKIKRFRFDWVQIQVGAKFRFDGVQIHKIAYCLNLFLLSYCARVIS